MTRKQLVEKIKTYLEDLRKDLKWHINSLTTTTDGVPVPVLTGQAHRVPDTDTLDMEGTGSHRVTCFTDPPRLSGAAGVSPPTLTPTYTALSKVRYVMFSK